MSVTAKQNKQEGGPSPRLGFTGSLGHSQPDEAGYCRHAQAESPNDGHADQAVWEKTGEGQQTFCDRSLSRQTRASARWVLTFLQGLVYELLQLQSLLVPWLIFQKGSDVLEGSLIVLGRKQELECKKKKGGGCPIDVTFEVLR